jgi:BON domain-containing protein
MPRIRSLIVAGLAGAAAAFLLDPQAGNRRRKMTRDRFLGLLRTTGRGARRIGHRLTADTRGLAQRMTHPRRLQRTDLDDATLAQKVQSELFRDRHLPKGDVNINVERGIVVLRGEVESPDVIVELAEEARRIPGVRGVESLLHVVQGP